MKYILIICAILTLSGCASATKDLSHIATDTRDNVAAIKISTDVIRKNVKNEQKVLAETVKIDNNANQIDDNIDKVVHLLPGLKDADPIIYKIIKLITMLGIFLSVAAILWKLSAFIPKPATKSAAQLLKKAMDDADKTTVREAVAVMRSSDKKFDKEFKK